MFMALFSYYQGNSVQTAAEEVKEKKKLPNKNTIHIKTSLVAQIVPPQCYSFSSQ